MAEAEAIALDTELLAQENSIRFLGRIKNRFGPVLGSVRNWARDQKLAIALATVFIPSVALACGGGKGAEVKIVPSTPTANPLAGAVTEGLPSIEATAPLVSPTAKPEAAKPIEVFQFVQIRERINEISTADEQKQQALEMIGKFESADRALQDFKAAYEAKREIDGTPTLLAMMRQKFGGFEKVFPEFKIEDQIFFLRDARLLQEVLISLQEKQNTELLSAVFLFGQKFFDETTRENRRRTIYIHAGSEMAGKVEFDLTRTTDPGAKEAAEKFKNFLAEIGIDGKINLKIILADKLSMGGAAGTFSDIPQTPKIEIAPPFKKEVLAAEIGHLIDIQTNTRLFYYLTPKEAVDLLILREKAMSDSEWGRRYPQVAKLFSREFFTKVTKWLKNEPLAPAEFAAAMLQSPRNWLWDDSVDRFQPPPKNYLHPLNASFDWHFNLNFDKELEGLMEKAYIEIPDYLEGTRELLDKLAGSSSWDQVFVALLREKGGNFPATGLVREFSIAHLRRILFFEAALQGDRRVADLFNGLTPAARKQILGSFLRNYNNTDGEVISDAVAAILTGEINGRQFTLENPTGNPYKIYFNQVISALP